jgi:hypothetical protein
MFLYFVILITLTNACHPECAWQCNSPVCPAVCVPICQPPVCSVTCPENRPCQITPQFYSSCPMDMCESDFCPECEILVRGLREFCPFCNGTCEEIECAWHCEKPECPYPRCELQCERPACEFIGPTTSASPRLGLW